MNDPVPARPARPPLNPAAVATAVAITAATGIEPPITCIEDLLGDTDPLDVLAALGVALNLTLGAALGEHGRADLLARIGIEAARKRP